MKLFELKMRLIAPLVVLSCFVFFGSQPAPGQTSKTDPGTNNPPPPGAILDLNGTPIPGGGNGTYQHYTVNFTATLTSTAITLAFRDDPAQVSVANVSVVDLANPSVNLLVNGNFSQGPVGSNTPTGWTYANQYGALAGGSVASGSRFCYTSAFCWLDGAVQAYDAISQTIATTIGHTYQISFDVAEDSATFAVPGNPILPAGYPGSDCYLAARGGPSPCKFSNISINGDTTNAGGNGINVTVYAQGGLPGTQTTYTSDTNIADFTSNIANYATFSNFANGDGCAISPFTPTSSELAGPNACRVYNGGTLTGLPTTNNWILATFPGPTSMIVVFPNIDHYGSAYDGYQYRIAGSNDLSTWSMLFDATSVNGCVSSCVVVGGEPFTLGNFTGTAPTTVNNVLTPGAGPGGQVGYIAQFQFGTTYKYYAFGASTVAVTQANPDQELSAVGTPATQVQTTPATNFTGTTTDTTVSVTFNNNNGQHVQGDAIFPKFMDLSFPTGIDAATVTFRETNRFVSNCQPYTIGTPFATCIPFDHAGNDAMSGTTGNGAKYEIICGDATHSPSEANCPIPNSGKHIRFKDIFDLPTNGSGFIQPPIAPGTTVSFLHWFPNTIPSVTSWSSSTASPHPACTSVFTATFACDFEDALVNKYGPSNAYGSDSRKGDYLLVYNIPMLCSAVKVNGMPVNTPCVQGSSTFFFHSPLTFNFLVSPAKCNPGLPVACGNGWIPAPPNTIFHTFDPLSSAPDLPAATDFEDFITCPAPPGTNCNDMITGTPGASNTASLGFTTPALMEAEGQFLLQWSAADTVKIRERNIQVLPLPPLGSPNPCPNPFNDNPAPTPPCYSTKLFNVQVTVDNTAPNVSTPVLTPPPVNGTYAVGQSVTASVNCVDVISGGVASGVVTCGKDSFTPAPTPPAGTQTSVNSSGNPVPTSTRGKQTFTLSAKDLAGNVGTSPGASFCVGYTITSVDRNGVVGFTQPVDNPGSGPQAVVNMVGSSQAIPLALTVVDCNGVPVSNLDLVGSTNVGTVKTVVLSATNAPLGTCATAFTDNSISTAAAGSSGWQILGNGVYDYNWKPMAPVGSCLAFSVNLGDNIPHIAYFNVVRK